MSVGIADEFNDARDESASTPAPEIQENGQLQPTHSNRLSKPSPNGFPHDFSRIEEVWTVRASTFMNKSSSLKGSYCYLGSMEMTRLQCI